MDEIKLGIAQHKGIRAQELLDNALLQETFQYLEGEYLKAWRASKAPETDAREAAWRAVKTLDVIQQHIKRYVADGKIAASDLRRLSEEYQRKKL